MGTLKLLTIATCALAAQVAWSTDQVPIASCNVSGQAIVLNQVSDPSSIALYAAQIGDGLVAQARIAPGYGMSFYYVEVLNHGYVAAQSETWIPDPLGGGADPSMTGFSTVRLQTQVAGKEIECQFKIGKALHANGRI